MLTLLLQRRKPRANHNRGKGLAGKIAYSQQGNEIAEATERGGNPGRQRLVRRLERWMSARPTTASWTRWVK